MKGIAPYGNRHWSYPKLYISIDCSLYISHSSSQTISGSRQSQIQYSLRTRQIWNYELIFSNTGPLGLFRQVILIILSKHIANEKVACYCKIKSHEHCMIVGKNMHSDDELTKSLDMKHSPAKQRSFMWAGSVIWTQHVSTNISVIDIEENRFLTKAGSDIFSIFSTHKFQCQ